MSTQNENPAGESPAGGEQLTDNGDVGFTGAADLLTRAIAAAQTAPEPGTEDQPEERATQPDAPAPPPPPPKPDEEVKITAGQLSKREAELEVERAKLRRQAREMEERQKQIEAGLQKVSLVEQAKTPMDALVAMAKARGADPYELFDQIASGIVEGKQLPGVEPTDPVQRKLQTLEQMLMEEREARKKADEAAKEHAQQSQVQQLEAGIADLVTKGAETSYPLLAAIGGEAAVKQIAHHIAQHHRQTGEVLRAVDLLEQTEKGYLSDLKRYIENPVVRRVLGIGGTTEQKRAAETKPSSNGSARADAVPSISNQVDAGLSPRSDEDDDTDDPEVLLRRATEAAQRG